MNQSVEYLGDQVCVYVGIRVRVVVGPSFEFDAHSRRKNLFVIVYYFFRRRYFCFSKRRELVNWFFQVG